MTSNLPLVFSPCRLQRQDATQVLAHFIRLSAPDRSQRFWGGLVTDDTIADYVRHLRFADDFVLGLRHGDTLIGVSHGARYSERGLPALEAAFSIDQPWRGRGLGTLLMQSLLAVSALDGVHEVVGMCAARNLRMRRIFEGADMALTREEDEWHARRRLDCWPRPAESAVMPAIDDSAGNAVPMRAIG
ncbi:MAG: GNAT family N-acetyltransferase [Burkholderiales bacterium]